MATTPRDPGAPRENPGEVTFEDLNLSPKLEGHGSFTDEDGLAFEFRLGNGYLDTCQTGAPNWQQDVPAHMALMERALRDRARAERGRIALNGVRFVFVPNPDENDPDGDEVGVGRRGAGSGAGAVLSDTAAWEDDEEERPPSGVSFSDFEVSEREIYVRGDIVAAGRSYRFGVLDGGVVCVMGDDYNWESASWANHPVQAAINERLRESGSEGHVELEEGRLVFSSRPRAAEPGEDEEPEENARPGFFGRIWAWGNEDIGASRPRAAEPGEDEEPEENAQPGLLDRIWAWGDEDIGTPNPLTVRRGFGGGGGGLVPTRPGTLAEVRQVSDAEMSVFRAAVIFDRLGVDDIIDKLGTFTAGTLNVAVSFGAFMHLSVHGARAGIDFIDYFKIAGYQAGNAGYGIVRGLVHKIPVVGTFIRENVLPEYKAYVKSAALFEDALKEAIQRARAAGVDEEDIDKILAVDAKIKKKWDDKAKKREAKHGGAHGAAGEHGEEAGGHGPKDPEAEKKELARVVETYLMYKDVLKLLKAADPVAAATLEEGIKRVHAGNLNAGQRGAGHSMHELLHENKAGLEKVAGQARSHFKTLMERAGLELHPLSQSASWFNEAIAHAQHHFTSPDAPSDAQSPVADRGFLIHVVNERFGWELRRQLNGIDVSEDARRLIGRLQASHNFHEIEGLIMGPEDSHNNERLGALVRAIVSGGGHGGGHGHP